jgi:hypothetical protein
MSLFEEPHCEWLAARIRELASTPVDPSSPQSLSIRDTVARKLGRDLQVDNPHFDVARFLEACGFCGESRR